MAPLKENKFLFSQAGLDYLFGPRVGFGSSETFLCCTRGWRQTGLETSLHSFKTCTRVIYIYYKHNKYELLVDTFIWCTNAFKETPQNWKYQVHILIQGFFVLWNKMKICNFKLHGNHIFWILKKAFFVYE